MEKGIPPPQIEPLAALHHSATRFACHDIWLDLSLHHNDAVANGATYNFLLVFHCNGVSYLASFLKYYHLCPKI